MKTIRNLSLLMFFALINFGLLNAQGGANIHFPEEKHNFGTIKEVNGPVAYHFEFINKGQSPLIIKDVEATCGCTTPEWTKKPIMPGQKGSIKAIYDPKNRPGTFEKTITVTSNAQNKNKYTLKISGEVEPKGLPKMKPQN